MPAPAMATENTRLTAPMTQRTAGEDWRAARARDCDGG